MKKVPSDDSEPSLFQQMLGRRLVGAVAIATPPIRAACPHCAAIQPTAVRISVIVVVVVIAVIIRIADDDRSAVMSVVTSVMMTTMSVVPEVHATAARRVSIETARHSTRTKIPSAERRATATICVSATSVMASTAVMASASTAEVSATAASEVSTSSTSEPPAAAHAPRLSVCPAARQEQRRPRRKNVFDVH